MDLQVRKLKRYVDETKCQTKGGNWQQDKPIAKYWKEKYGMESEITNESLY